MVPGVSSSFSSRCLAACDRGRVRASPGSDFLRTFVRASRRRHERSRRSGPGRISGPPPDRPGMRPFPSELEPPEADRALETPTVGTDNGPAGDRRYGCAFPNRERRPTGHGRNACSGRPSLLRRCPSRTTRHGDRQLSSAAVDVRSTRRADPLNRASADRSRTVAIGAAASRPCTLVVCRGCCCGDPRKYPDDDHAWQLERLRAGAEASGGRFVVRTVDCLGPCDQANVVVVQPSGDARRRGARAIWIGFAMGDDCTEELVSWASAGGPGIAEPPVALELQFVRPPREARARTRR